VARGLPDTHLATAKNERRQASHHHTVSIRRVKQMNGKKYNM
jgi:hypothetical protein